MFIFLKGSLHLTGNGMFICVETTRLGRYVVVGSESIRVLHCVGSLTLIPVNCSNGPVSWALVGSDIRAVARVQVGCLAGMLVCM